jgi:Phage-related protein
MTDLIWVGSSLKDLKDFPESARVNAGYQLRRVQNGLEPNDWKSMSTIGTGVREIRLSEEEGIFRVIYVTHIGDAIHVLHCFQKKSQKTPQSDIDLAKRRFRDISPH